MKESVDFSIESANKLLKELHQNQQELFFEQADLFDGSKRSLDLILKESCEKVAKLIDCERVEIWLFNDDQTKLTAKTGYDAREKINTFDQVLYREKAPDYFAAIVDKRTLAVNDTTTSSIMHGLNVTLSQEYHQTNAMLDASIILSSGVGGVLCCLSERRREWTSIHKHILASVADSLAFIFDSAYKHEIEDHVYELAFTDTLTGLNNQHAFLQKVTEQLEANHPHERKVFLYFTIDQFTDIQSVLGHDGSDQVLIEIAQRLRVGFPAPAILARIGFDHFVIYSPIKMDDHESRISLEHIKVKFKEPMIIRGMEVYVSFSFGVSYYPDPIIKNAKDGVQAAQIALENARKIKSRNAVGVFQHQMHSLMKDNLLSEMNLRKGLDLNQFELFYQPQVICQTGEVTGFEALIRWNHPEKGLIYPSDFINIAESTGLITVIGRWVIDQAFTQLGKWQRNGKEDLTISINLSSQHFLHEQLPQSLMTSANQANVNPQKLVLEITENMELEDYEAVKRRIEELKGLGFSVSIDDFGTGYSSFIYLQHFPVEQIKIDRQFIRNVDKDLNNQIITKSIIELGKRFKLQTIAEGVETIDEWKFLQEVHCDEIQGYYFSKPLPICEINELMGDTGEAAKYYLP